MLVRLCLRRLVLVTFVLRIFVLGIFVVGIVVSGPSTAAAAQAPRFVPPVDAPVSDPYRPPTTPYGPGNRGIEYATAFGTEVRASGTGVVAFAGVIAHELYVSIDHEGGIRTTYSYLTTIEVVAGQTVGQGEIVGISGARLHFGARRFGAYIDPASLFEAVAPRRARLLPIAGLPWT
jgi:murein DD-endopeptidase MepM/ murein hydrolase activator NlpD